MSISLGADFGRALCAHFGLPANQVMAGITMSTAADEIFGATLTIAMSADDLAAIAVRMKAPVVARTGAKPLARDPALAKHPAVAMGFDAWMRQRTDAAHIELMQRGKARRIDAGLLTALQGAGYQPLEGQCVSNPAPPPRKP